MSDVQNGSITASWNGVLPAIAGSFVQLQGFSFKPLTQGTSREDASLGIAISGTWTATLQFEASIDGTVFFPIAAFPALGVTAVHATSTTVNGNWIADTEGLRIIRIRCSAYTSGTAVIDLVSSISGVSVATSGCVTGPYVFSNITTVSNTTLKTGSGVLHAITFNKPVATGVIQVSDATSKTTPIIGTITVPASPMPVTLIYDAQFNVGLNIDVATAAQDITVCWK